jgi:brefeldin A-resistance guanine nucleotide exchange factor 1
LVLGSCKFYMLGEGSFSCTLWDLQENVSPESLLFTKSRKLLVLTAAQKFNEKPKKGVLFMLENGLVDYKADEDVEATQKPEGSSQIEKKEQPRKADPKSLAQFLKSCPRLDKKVLGEYISNLDNPELLKEFIGMFDFRNVSVNLDFGLGPG